MQCLAGLSSTTLNPGEGRESHGVGQLRIRPGSSSWSVKRDSKCANRFTNHKGSTCPASWQTCRKCGKVGHYGRCCMSKGQSQVQEVDCADDSGPALETVRINVVGQSDSVQYRRCTCEIADVPLSLVIDLGAKVSVLSKASYDKCFHGCELQLADRKLVGYAGSPIEVLGKVQLPVRYRECQLARFSFYITGSGTDILGLDLFDALGFQICWKQQELDSHTLQAVDVLEGDRITKENWASKWPRVFNGLGKAKQFEHCPLVNAAVPPVMQLLRRLPLALREDVGNELDRWESQDIIEKMESSSWISNPVVVRKKSGSIRLCVDLRRVNQAVIPGKHPLPTLEDITAEFHGSTVFSKLDLNQGYLQIPLAEERRYITAFVTHKGVNQFKRMAFGLSSAPSAVMVTVVVGAPGVAVYMDDIVVHGPDRPTHDRRLHEVFRRLQDHNLTVNAEKCVLQLVKFHLWDIGSP